VKNNDNAARIYLSFLTVDRAGECGECERMIGYAFDVEMALQVGTHARTLHATCIGPVYLCTVWQAR